VLAQLEPVIEQLSTVAEYLQHSACKPCINHAGAWCASGHVQMTLFEQSVVDTSTAFCLQAGLLQVEQSYFALSGNGFVRFECHEPAQLPAVYVCSVNGLTFLLFMVTLFVVFAACVCIVTVYLCRRRRRQKHRARLARAAGALQGNLGNSASSASLLVDSQSEVMYKV
jgi:hypothetical protein